jgi:hypothetical protein
LTIILLVGVEVSIKSPNSTVFAGVGAIWKLAPQDIQNTYSAPGEIAEDRILRCKKRGCATYLIGTELVAAGGIELAEKIKKSQFKAGKLGGLTARTPEIWRAT